MILKQTPHVCSDSVGTWVSHSSLWYMIGHGSGSSEFIMETLYLLTLDSVHRHFVICPASLILSVGLTLAWWCDSWAFSHSSALMTASTKVARQKVSTIDMIRFLKLEMNCIVRSLSLKKLPSTNLSRVRNLMWYSITIISPYSKARNLFFF